MDLPYWPTKNIGVDENTPIQIGSTLYSCTPTNIITALDGDSGKALWKYDPKAKQLNTLPVVVLVTMMRLRIKRFQKQIYKLLVFKPAHNEF